MKRHDSDDEDRIPPGKRAKKDEKGQQNYFLCAEIIIQNSLEYEYHTDEEGGKAFEFENKGDEKEEEEEGEEVNLFTKFSATLDPSNYKSSQLIISLQFLRVTGWPKEIPASDNEEEMPSENLEHVQWDAPGFKKHPLCFACYSNDPRIKEHRKCGHPGFGSGRNELPDVQRLLYAYIRAKLDCFFCQDAETHFFIIAFY